MGGKSKKSKKDKRDRSGSGNETDTKSQPSSSKEKTIDESSAKKGAEEGGTGRISRSPSPQNRSSPSSRRKSPARNSSKSSKIDEEDDAERVQQLEKEVADLRDKLKDAESRKRSKSNERGWRRRRRG